LRPRTRRLGRRGDDRWRLKKSSQGSIIQERAMAAPLVSVVIPCFNYERYVAEAVASALDQDWPALEVIAVDDGSTDRSPEILAGFGDAIRVIRRHNGGLNAATDTGLAAARGEFVTFLDADDTWPQGRLRVLAETLIADPGAAVSYGDMTVVDRDGAVVHESFNEYKGNAPPPSGRFLGRLLSFNCVSAGSLMVRASLRDRYHPIPAFAAWNDWWIATQLLREAEIVAVPDCVNIYREHGANMNLGGDEARAVALLRTELPFRRWLLNHSAPPLVSIPDLLAGLATFDWAVARVTAFDGEPPVTLLAAEGPAAAQALTDGREALRRAQTELGVATLVAAIAHAPLWDEPRELLQSTLDVLAEGPQARPTTRNHVEGMALEQILADPARLTAWVAAHEAAPATLVITGVADEEARLAVISVVETLGLADHAGADLLAVAERDPAAVAVRLGRPFAGAIAF
jgi:hypothetical protein